MTPITFFVFVTRLIGSLYAAGGNKKENKQHMHETAHFFGNTGHEREGATYARATHLARDTTLNASTGINFWGKLNIDMTQQSAMYTGKMSHARFDDRLSLSSAKKRILSWSVSFSFTRAFFGTGALQVQVRSGNLVTRVVYSVIWMVSSQ